jgi:hypothetical protein
VGSISRVVFRGMRKEAGVSEKEKEKAVTEIVGDP